MPKAKPLKYDPTLTGQALAHQFVLAWLVHRIGQITPYEESQAKFNELAEVLSKDAAYPRTIRDAAVDELSLIRGLKPLVHVNLLHHPTSNTAYNLLRGPRRRVNWRCLVSDPIDQAEGA